MTNITVVSPSRFPPSGDPGKIFLQQDNWNDYSFHTQYHLFISHEGSEGNIGPVKILKRSQTSAGGLQLPVGEIAPLGPDFCSLGQSLDYYERLASLPEPLRRQVLTDLRDALANPDHAETFFDEEGWRVSILRDIDWETFRRDASVLLERDYDKVARLGLDLSFQVAGWNEPLRLKFDSSGGEHIWRMPGERSILPERIAVLTGQNGCGKSTLLARLARVLHGSQKDRSGPELKNLGTIDPPGIGFTRVVNVAYSAFDTFQIPGIGERERRQIVNELAKGAGRYHFCGLRDLAREMEREADFVGPNAFGSTPSDRQKENRLKSAAQLGEEFKRTILHIDETGRTQLLNEVLAMLATDPSFVDLRENPLAVILHDAVAAFERWSTGHKIVMHATTALVGYTEPKSIVLIDEPECHLHPPLLAAFMHAIRFILEKNDAFAVVATHSPVVVQETLSQHVSIVRRHGEQTTILSPRIETYGESIGEITDEIFGLTSDATDYHAALSRLVQSDWTLESIESLFDRGLSFQARAYVMSELARKS